MFEKAGLDLNKPITSTCYIGHTACIFALAAAVCGKEDVSVYSVKTKSFFKHFHLFSKHSVQTFVFYSILLTGLNLAAC